MAYCFHLGPREFLPILPTYTPLSRTNMIVSYLVHNVKRLGSSAFRFNEQEDHQCWVGEWGPKQLSEEKKSSERLPLKYLDPSETFFILLLIPTKMLIVHCVTSLQNKQWMAVILKTPLILLAFVSQNSPVEEAVSGGQVSCSKFDFSSVLSLYILLLRYTTCLPLLSFCLVKLSIFDNKPLDIACVIQLSIQYRALDGITQSGYDPDRFSSWSTFWYVLYKRQQECCWQTLQIYVCNHSLEKFKVVSPPPTHTHTISTCLGFHIIFQKW